MKRGRKPKLKPIPKISVRKKRPKITKTGEFFHCEEEQCDYKTEFISNYRRHRQCMHDNIRFSCSYCDKSFADKYNRAIHISAKHKGKPVVCDLCGKNFTSRNGYYEHKRRVHDKNPRYKCNICNKEYSVRSIFEAHSNTHAGFKSYFCEKCDKKFTYKNSLQVHKATCTGIKTKIYSCPICSRVYNRASILRDHIKGKHENTQIICGCGKTFSWRTSYNRHVKTCPLAPVSKRSAIPKPAEASEQTLPNNTLADDADWKKQQLVKSYVSSDMSTTDQPLNSEASTDVYNSNLSIVDQHQQAELSSSTPPVPKEHLELSGSVAARSVTMTPPTNINVIPINAAASNTLLVNNDQGHKDSLATLGFQQRHQPSPLVLTQQLSTPSGSLDNRVVANGCFEVQQLPDARSLSMTSNNNFNDSMQPSRAMSMTPNNSNTGAIEIQPSRSLNNTPNALQQSLPQQQQPLANNQEMPRNLVIQPHAAVNHQNEMVAKNLCMSSGLSTSQQAPIGIIPHALAATLSQQHHHHHQQVQQLQLQEDVPKNLVMVQIQQQLQQNQVTSASVAVDAKNLVISSFSDGLSTTSSESQVKYFPTPAPHMSTTVFTRHGSTSMPQVQPTVTATSASTPKDMTLDSNMSPRYWPMGPNVAPLNWSNMFPKY